MQTFNINKLCLLYLILLTGCTPKEYYLKPEVYGQLVDSKNKKPIANMEGYIGYTLSENNIVRTDSKGKFKISPKAESYYFFRPNLKKLSQTAPYIYISFDAYEPKSVDYSNMKSLNPIDSNIGAKVLEKGDVGIIYLDPKVMN